MRKATFALIALLSIGFAFAQSDTIFVESFEGPLTWEVGDLYWYGDTLAYWHADTFNSIDGISFWCGSMNVGGTIYHGYNDGWLQYLDLAEISIPAAPSGSVLLSFQQKLNCEPSGGTGYPFMYDGWDGATVWLSEDGGLSWETIEATSPALGYDCTSLWGFGFCGLGPNYPAWTGERGIATPETPIFDLSSYAGSDIIVRFVFASDMMFSTGPTNSPTSYDPDMFGWIIDNITVTDTDDTLYYATDGTANFSVSQGRKLETWELTDETASVGTHSMMTRAYSESYATLISPMFTIPDTFAGKLYLDVKMNYTNYDPDDDNSLDDYFTVMIVDSTADTTIQIMYNYYRPGLIDETWRTFNDDALFGSMTNSLRDFAGHDVRIMIMSRGDGLPDTTHHLYVDNIVVAGYYALLHDIAPTNIAAGPLSPGNRGRFTVVLSNLGMNMETMLQVNGTITYPDGSDSAVSFWPRPSVDGGSYATVFKEVNTLQPGDYTVKAWTALATDLNVHNDTIEVTFTVPDYGTMELGWDDGVNDVASDVTSGITLEGFLGGGVEVGNALGNRFAVGTALTGVSLSAAKFYTNFTGTAKITVLGHFAGIPNGAPVLYTGNHSVVSDPEGSWVTVDLSSEGISIPDSIFFIFVGTAIDSQMPMIGIDVTSPLERWGFAILGPDTIFLREGAVAPYSAIDLMIRAVVSGTHGIEYEGVTLPKEVALHNNYPNPFNPATAISFELPAETDIELSVFNLLGERVTTLADGKHRAGMHRVTWAGKDDNGRDLPSGVYFYRLSTSEKDITKRMILIK
jgi:hypothetical protein